MGAARKKSDIASFTRDAIAVGAAHDIAKTREAQEKVLHLQERQALAQQRNLEQQGAERLREKALEYNEIVIKLDLKIQFIHMPFVENIALARAISIKDAAEVFRGQLMAVGLDFLLPENAGGRVDILTECAVKYELSAEDLEQCVDFKLHHLEDSETCFTDCLEMQQESNRETALAAEKAASERAAAEKRRIETGKNVFLLVGALINSFLGGTFLLAGLFFCFNRNLGPLSTGLGLLTVGIFWFTPTFFLIKKSLLRKLPTGFQVLIRIAVIVGAFSITMALDPKKSTDAKSSDAASTQQIQTKGNE